MSEVLIRLRKIAANNSLNLFFGQESKSFYSNGSFLLLNDIFRKKQEKKGKRKKRKKLTAVKYTIFCTLPETEDHINSFHVNCNSLYYLKTTENL